MTEIATIDWFGRWGISVFSENTAIFLDCGAGTERIGTELRRIRHEMTGNVTNFH